MSIRRSSNNNWDLKKKEQKKNIIIIMLLVALKLTESARSMFIQDMVCLIRSYKLTEKIDRYCAMLKDWMCSFSLLFFDNYARSASEYTVPRRTLQYRAELKIEHSMIAGVKHNLHLRARSRFPNHRSMLNFALIIFENCTHTHARWQ